MMMLSHILLHLVRAVLFTSCNLADCDVSVVVVVVTCRLALPSGRLCVM